MSYSEKAVQVYELFKENLTEHHIKFETDDEHLVLKMIVHGEDLPQPTFIQVDDERSVVQILSPIPSRIPDDKRMDAAVAVAIANYGMINGSFDLDMSDGEIRFRVTQSYADMELSQECISYLIGIVFFTTDKYNDKFFMLGKGMISIEQFIESAEKK